MISLILGLSALLQIIAAITALFLMRLTKRRWAWILISSALFLMFIRRSVTLYQHLQQPDVLTFSLEAEVIALATSFLLLIGIYLFYPIITSLRKESDNLFEQLINATPGALAFILDADGNLKASNKTGREWLGSNSPSDYSLRFQQLFGIPLASTLRAVEVNAQLIPEEVFFLGRWYTVAINPLRDRQGNISGFAVYMNDISVIKQSHEKEKEHEQKLLQADKLSSLGMMVSGLAHEINNPTQFIRSHLSTLEKVIKATEPILNRYHDEYGDFRLAGLSYQQTRQEIPVLLEEIKTGTVKIQRILSELKRFGLEKKQTDFERVNLLKVADSALVLLRNLINSSTENFVFQFDNKTPDVAGDAQQLEQVLINLISNACQALETQEASILLMIKPIAGKVNIIVEDTGCGIEPENIRKLTDPFFTTRKDRGGTGLGLAVTKSIVEGHGGRLEFGSQPGKGTRVTVVLRPFQKDQG